MLVDEVAATGMLSFEYTYIPGATSLMPFAAAAADELKLWQKDQE